MLLLVKTYYRHTIVHLLRWHTQDSRNNKKKFLRAHQYRPTQEPPRDQPYQAGQRRQQPPLQPLRDFNSSSHVFSFFRFVFSEK